MTKLGLAGSALLATAGGATTLASGLTITAHASEKPKTNTQQPNQADKLKKASNQLDTASKQQAKMINALLESKVDAQVPTQPGTYTKSVALLDASGKQLGTATLTRVVNADGSTQSSLSKDIPAGYTLKDVSVLNHYPSAVTLTRVAGATQAGTTTKAIKLTDASGKLIATGTATRVVDEEGASTVSVKGIPQGYKVANMGNLSDFPDQIVIEKGEPINSNTAENTDAGTMNNVPAGGTTADSRKILDSGGVTKTAGQGNATAGNQSGTTTGNTGSQSGQAQQGGTTTDNGTSATDSATNAQGVPVSDAVKYDLAHHIIINYGGAITPPEKPVEKPVTTVNTANATNSNQANTTDSNTDTNAQTGLSQAQGQQTSDASKDSSKTSTDSKTTTDQGKTDTKKDDSKTPTSTTDSAKKDDTKKDDSRASTSKNTSASTDEKKDEAKKGDSKSDTSKTNASKTTDNSKTNDTNSKVDNAIKSIDSVAKGSTDATKSADSKSSDTDKKDDSKKSNSSKSGDKKSDDKKSDKKDGKLDLSDTTDALKKSSKDDDKKDSSAKKSDSDDSSKKDNVSNLLNKSVNKSSKASDNAKVADANVSDNLSGKDNSTKEGTTSSSTNTTLPETGNTQSTAGILAGSAMVATMTALGIGATRRKRV